MDTNNKNIENTEEISKLQSLENELEQLDETLPKKEYTEKQLNLLILINKELVKEEKYDLAIEKYLAVLEKFEKSEISSELSANIKTEILFQIATISFIQKEFSLSESFFIRVIEWNEKNNISEKNRSSLHNIGNIFAIQKEWNKALEYYELAIEDKNETDNNTDLGKTFFNIRIILSETINIKKRLKYYKKRLKFYEKQGKSELFGYFYHEIALLYADYNNKKKEKEYLEKALVSKKKYKIEFEFAHIYYFLADFYDIDDQEEKAFEYYIMALEYMLKYEDFKNAGPTVQYLELSMDECTNEELKQRAINLLKIAEKRNIFEEKRTIFNGIEIGEYSPSEEV